MLHYFPRFDDQGPLRYHGGMEQELSSIHNPRVKAIARLSDRGERRSTGLCLVEGRGEILTAISAGVVLDTLFYCLELARPGDEALHGPCQRGGAQIVRVSAAVMAKMAYREHPDGYLLLVRFPDTSLPTFLARSEALVRTSRQAGLYVLAEDVEKPGNLGAVLRSADAAGAHGFVAAQTRTDLANPNVVRSSKAAVFALPCAEASNADSLAWFRSQGVRVVAASPSARKIYWDVDLGGPVVIAVGAEKEGLSDFWMDQADEKVLIPMAGKVNSLNLAQAATLFLYEAARQRRPAG